MIDLALIYYGDYMKPISSPLFSNLKNQLLNHGFIHDDLMRLQESAKQVELPARAVLFQQGSSVNEVYFLLEGICHAAYLTPKGKTFSKEFYWENDWIIGFESLISAEPSPFRLETVTPCTLISLPMAQLRAWRLSHQAFYLFLVETQLTYKEQKERYMLLNTPQERYALFCQNYPHLVERLSDYHIAAYLGITPISLSRIKKRPRLNDC
jgi:CRP-like cAMP-binding protein